MTTIRDISSYCGVSVATVSKALNGQQDISEKTREKVLAAAAKLGYCPNAQARALRMNRTYNLGVLFEDAQHSGLNHEHFSSVLEGFRSEAESQGYDVTFINRNVGTNPLGYLEHCRYRGVDGVCIVCVDFEDPQVLELAESDLPLISIDHVFSGCSAILSDNERGTGELVRYAIQMGHRDIAFLHGEEVAVTRRRLAGFWQAVEECGLTVSSSRVRSTAYHDAAGCERETAKLLAEGPHPTCILFPDDVSALGGMAAIARAGFRIPEDISVMGYDGNRLAPYLLPALTTYHQDTRELGKKAAEKLVELIEKPRKASATVCEVEGWLVKGASVAQQ